MSMSVWQKVEKVLWTRYMTHPVAAMVAFLVVLMWLIITFSLIFNSMMIRRITPQPIDKQEQHESIP